MGKEKPFQPVKLFCGVIYRQQSDLERMKWVLQEHLSAIDLESPEIPFDCTDYYSQEMGSPLFRGFISFEKLITPEELPGIKLLTNHIEDEAASEGRRIVNLDPGYLSAANVIIATTKNYFHRVPLANGIYAHMEYVIVRKRVTPLEWTYPDFKTPPYIDFFTELRALYKDNLKKL